MSLSDEIASQVLAASQGWLHIAMLVNSIPKLSLPSAVLGFLGYSSIGWLRYLLLRDFFSLLCESRVHSNNGGSERGGCGGDVLSDVFDKCRAYKQRFPPVRRLYDAGLFYSISACTCDSTPGPYT